MPRKLQTRPAIDPGEGDAPLDSVTSARRRLARVGSYVAPAIVGRLEVTQRRSPLESTCHRRRPAEAPTEEGPPELARVLDLLAELREVDLRDHRVPQIEREMHRRMVAAGVPSTRKYVELLSADPSERRLLASALVVSVTRFFRDVEVFEALASVLRDHRSTLRAWVIGAATGEEAWSLAAVLDALGREGAGDFEVVATDIDRTALASARIGEYAVQPADTIPDRYASSFVTTESGAWSVAERLRHRVQFSTHDVVGKTLAPAESFVAAFDLVLLRNVLIYFDDRLQRKAFGRMSAVLARDGLLVLGPAESVPREFESAFEPHPDVDERLRIYRRR